MNVEILKTYITFFFMITNLMFVPFNDVHFYLLNYLVVLVYILHFFFPVYIFSINLHGYMIILLQCIFISLICEFLYPLYIFLGVEFTFFFNTNHLFLEDFTKFFIKKERSECIICYEDCSILKICEECNSNVCYKCSTHIYKCPICRIYY